MKAPSWRGYIYIASAALCWGVSATLGRAAFTGRLFPAQVSLRAIDPLILSQGRTTFSFLVIFPALFLARGWSRIRLSRPDFLRMLALGILGVAASNYFYYLAIQRTNVAIAIIVQYTAPVWVLLYLVARKLQRATVARVAAVLLAITGTALVIGLFTPRDFHLDVLGVLAALGAALSFSFYNIGGHRMLERYDHWMVLLYATFTASLFWIVINPPWKIAAAHYSAPQWLFLAAFSMISVLAPFSLYFAGLRYLDPGRAVIVSCLEPVFSIVITALALGELVRPSQIFGIVIVLAAIVVVQFPDGRSRQPVALVEPME